MNAPVFGRVDDSTLIARRVGELYFGTCAAPDYLAACGQPWHPNELEKHRCINHFSPRTGKVFDWVFAKNGVRIQASLRGLIALDDENSYLAAAEAGLGIAIAEHDGIQLRSTVRLRCPRPGD